MLTEKTKEETPQKSFNVFGFRCFEGSDRCPKLREFVNSNKNNIKVVSVSETNADVTLWYWHS